MEKSKVEINIIFTLFFYNLFIIFTLTFITLKMIKYSLKGAVIMVRELNISWSKTKKNVEQLISKYMLYSLSVDNSNSYSINDPYLLKELEIDKIDKNYIKLDLNELKKRIDFVNYVRFSFNKLTTDERKIIYWTYIDKEDNYDDRYIANNLGFSLGYYYIKKKETLIRFAYSLGVEEIVNR